ncbi:MAG: sulfite exporter TauE/SafE family protein [Candidatus Omnitrophica bacterium]|nr:sulfite exporter TauE/SafE family protein [Candidatus Omnitrophota bacterium]
MKLLGNPLDFFLAFLSGIFISFTPCIYPLLPITAGIIGATSFGARRKGFIISLIYVSGMAITYSFLGLIASLTGKLFGAVSTHPLTYFVVGVIVVFFGLVMLDIFNLRLPTFAKSPRQEKGNYISTFFLGLTSGLIVSPCLTPVLGTILTYLITRKNILYGMFLLFSFAYGMGLSLILIGSFSSLLLSLPKPGQWMLYVKRICALVLVIMGAYFIISGIKKM